MFFLVHEYGLELAARGGTARADEMGHTGLQALSCLAMALGASMLAPMVLLLLRVSPIKIYQQAHRGEPQ